MVSQLYEELAAKGLDFRPPVYLSDQWGCPDGTPLIGVPFYLADPRLTRLEEEMAVDVEGEHDAMRYLRHEAGHAFNYAYRLYERPDWHKLFGPYSRPYRERYRADPFSRQYVRHILGWYAQKHPDEDFAETFAVWLTPGLDWRSEYAGWPALGKLEYLDAIMREIADADPAQASPQDDDMPVESMHYSLAEHYEEDRDGVPIEDERQFDVDLRQLFVRGDDAPAGESAHQFLRRHYREIVTRVAFWTSESPSVVRSLVDMLMRRTEALGLKVGALEAATLIELTAFATAVVMLHRHTHAIRRARGNAARPARIASAGVP